jgi:hypothetical protein
MHGLSDKLYALPTADELRELLRKHSLTGGEAGRLVGVDGPRSGSGQAESAACHGQPGPSCFCCSGSARERTYCGRLETGRLYAWQNRGKMEPAKVRTRYLSSGSGEQPRFQIQGEAYEGRRFLE